MSYVNDEEGGCRQGQGWTDNRIGIRDERKEKNGLIAVNSAIKPFLSKYYRTHLLLNTFVKSGAR